MSVHLFGIRHHGPGSARSVKVALEALQPDCLLVEGPPEADNLLALMLQEGMNPPVALLLYAQDDPARAVFYPFAGFSPEWQALQYALRQGIPTRFFDLPMTHRLAAETQLIESKHIQRKPDDHAALQQDENLPDPLQLVAQAAGYDDFETWWGQLIEERQDSDQVFKAILSVMSAVREKEAVKDIKEAQREAYMRQMIRTVQQEGFKRIAVVCGAFHTPALTIEALEQHTNDQQVLEDLPTTKVAVTWIPWTFGRLSRYSGYGAGIHSPGWYEHVWQSYQPGTAASSVSWLAKIAGLLRDEGLEASSAQVIEGVRLADTLAAMRGNAKAGLDELSESAYAVFAHGNDLVMELIKEKLIVGERLGKVPSATPAAPLQQDLNKEIKRLRLVQDATVRDLELDLRKELDLQRSHLLRRLTLLGIPWGHSGYSSSKGTFKEAWQLKWEPEYVVSLIEAGRFGQTVECAVTGFVLEHSADPDTTLQVLAATLEQVLLAYLPNATSALLAALERQAAQDNDIFHLMAALPALARIVRYGDVRQRDEQPEHILLGVVESFLVRICIGLPNAAHSISDEAAEALFGKLLEVDSAVNTLQISQQITLWEETLHKLGSSQVHGLIQGRAVRLLMQAGKLSTSEVSGYFTLALSNPEPEKASAWLEGFLRGSGLILIHDPVLLGILDTWLANLPSDTFVRLLPLLRRTFSSFDIPERRSIGEKVKRVETGLVASKPNDAELDHQRGQRVLPIVTQLLGLPDRRGL